MAIAGLRQDIQVQPSFTVDDTAAAGQSLVTNSTSLEGDLNAIRAQLSRVLDATGGKRFYETPYAVGGTTYGLKQAADSIYATQQQKFTQVAGVYTSIAVPAGANYVVLNAAGNQAPSGPLAIGATTVGAVVAKSSLNGTAFAANELTVLAGADTFSPRNRVTIRNNADGSPIEDSQTRDIYGLLQVESTGSDGVAANDTSAGNRVKISFYKIDYANKALIAADPADVAGLSINYLYRQRLPFAQLPEGAISGGGSFVDNIGVADVTMTRAVANQAGQPIPVVAPVLFQVPNGQTFKVQNSNGGQDFLAVVPTAGGTTASVNVTQLQATTTQPSQFTQGGTFATSTQSVNVGNTLGQVDSAGLTVASTGGNPLKLVSTATLQFKDAYLAQSNWTAPNVVLASGAADYNNYKTAFGEVSITQAVYTAARSAAFRIAYARCLPVTIPAGTNITGAGASANLSVQLVDYSMISDLSRVLVLFNGVLLEPGSANAWIPGTNRANGDIILTFALRAPTSGIADRIQMQVFGSM